MRERSFVGMDEQIVEKVNEISVALALAVVAVGRVLADLMAAVTVLLVHLVHLQAHLLGC